MEIASDHVRREFGFCRILWKIEQFYLVACKNDWTITSPVFTVRAPFSTTWAIILNSEPQDEIEKGDPLISVSLKRLKSDSGPDTVVADWKIGILNGRRNEYNFLATKGYFKENTVCETGLQTLNGILKEFQPFQADVLHLQCQLIVSLDNTAEFSKCIEQGIISLSEDLAALYSSRNDCDVTLKVKDNHILVHKAILYVRNPTLAKIFDSKPDDQLIELFPTQPSGSVATDPFLNSADVEKVFQYLYSGNLKFVIGEPSVSIYECAMLFDVGDVIQYYTPDDLTLQSSIEIEELVFIWIVRDFESINQACILSPPLGEMTSETIWRLRLLPSGEGYYTEYLSIFAEVIEGTRLQDVCLEFAITNVNHEYSNYRRIRQKSVGLGENLGVPDFVSRNFLKISPFLENGTVRVIFKLRMSGHGGSPTSSSYESDSTSVVSTNTIGKTLETLSEDMSFLLDEGKFSDAEIYCEDKVFRVHKCVLGARSDSLSKVLYEKLKDKDEIYFADVKPEIFSILLSYIYTGTIDDFNRDVISEIYQSAEEFNMYGLMTKSLQIFNRTKPS